MGLALFLSDLHLLPTGLLLSWVEAVPCQRQVVAWAGDSELQFIRRMAARPLWTIVVVFQIFIASLGAGTVCRGYTAYLIYGATMYIHSQQETQGRSPRSRERFVSYRHVSLSRGRTHGKADEGYQRVRQLIWEGVDIIGVRVILTSASSARQISTE